MRSAPPLPFVRPGLEVLTPPLPPRRPSKHPDLPDEVGATALILAAHEGQLEVVCCLLNVGADANAVTKVRYCVAEAEGRDGAACPADAR